MKTRKLLVLCLISCVPIFNGCKKSNDVNESKNTVVYTFKGTKYSVSNLIVSTSQNVLSITGSGSGSGIAILITNYAVGTFQVGQGFDNAVLSQPVNSTSGYMDVSGTVTITSLTSTEVIGNFQCQSVELGQDANTATPLTGTFDVGLQ